MDLIPFPVDYHVLSCVSLEPSRFYASKNPETPNYFSHNPTSRPSPSRFACEKSPGALGITKQYMIMPTGGSLVFLIYFWCSVLLLYICGAL